MTHAALIACTPELVVVIGKEAGGATVSACQDVLDAGTGLDGLLAALQSSGPAATPSFACAALEGDDLRILLRGDVTVRCGPGAAPMAAGPGLRTWREELVGRARTVAFDVAGREVLAWYPPVGAAPVDAVLDVDRSESPAESHARRDEDDHTLADVDDAAGGSSGSEAAADVPEAASEETALHGGTPWAGGPPPELPARLVAGQGKDPDLPSRLEPPTPATDRADQPPAAERGPVTDDEQAGATGNPAVRPRSPEAPGPASAGPQAPGGLIVGVPTFGAAGAVPPAPTAPGHAVSPASAAPPPTSPASPPAGEHTVVRPSISPQGAGPAPATGVTSVLCPMGHANPPHTAVCRVCDRPIADASIRQVPRPVVARLRFADGNVVDLDRTHIVGRRPTVPPGSDAGQPVGLHAVADHEQELSRNHIEVRLDGWSVSIVDLGSVNGTWVANPGQEPVRIRAHVPQTAVLGATVRLAEVTSFDLVAPT